MKMQKRYQKLTDNQQKAWEILQASPGEWLKASDIWNILNPGRIPGKMTLASFGYALHFLPPKVQGLYEKWEEYDKVYQYSPDNVRPEDALPMRGTHAPKQQGSISDQDLIREALLHYSTVVVETDPDKALQVILLAKKFQQGQGTSKYRSKPRKVRVGTSNLEEEATPEEEGEVWEGAPMPLTLTREELLTLAEEAYRDEKFIYSQVAERAKLPEDYVIRILEGTAIPSRKMMERIYSAIFPIS